MPERNRIVTPRNNRIPYPNQELQAPNGELENYFLHASNLLDYYDRPQTITSTKFDVYANWLHSLQFTDPNNPEDHERGTTALLRLDPLELVFPRNPNVGNRINGRVSIIPMFPVKNPNYQPLILMHSHYDSTCHSPEDLEIPIMNEGIWSYQNDFLGDIVSARRQNFMLLRTQQSRFTPIKQAEQRTKEINHDIQLLAEQRSAEIGQLLSKDSHNAKDMLEKLILQREKQIFGSDFVRYFASMAHTLNIAEEFKLGFYVSNKDGIYRLVQSNVLEILEELQAQAVHKGIDDLARVAS
jgi:hypothetical protein